jgi:hypothetical protein
MAPARLSSDQRLEDVFQMSWFIVSVLCWSCVMSPVPFPDEASCYAVTQNNPVLRCVRMEDI